MPWPPRSRCLSSGSRCARPEARRSSRCSGERCSSSGGTLVIGIHRFLATTEGADTDWPKLPAGTMIKVHSGGDRFFVELRGTNEAAAGQVLEAALVYKPRR